MSNQNSLTNELTGNSGVKTDHGGLGVGDLVVLLLDAVLMIYTVWRSYDFLSTTVPTGLQVLAMVGLWGLDIGAIAWSLVWIFGSSGQYQDWVSMAFFVIDLIGMSLTSLTDSLMYGAAKGGEMSTMLTGIAVVVIPLIVVANVVAGFIYHMTSPETKARRENRHALAEHKRQMAEIAAMERDMTYAESYLLTKQETLEKAKILADISVAQAALEKATRAQLRDQMGVQKNANEIAGKGNDEDKLAVMKAYLAELRSKINSATPNLKTPSTDEQLPLESIFPDPPNYHPTGEELERRELALASGAPSETAVKGNGHGKTDPI